MDAMNTIRYLLEPSTWLGLGSLLGGTSLAVMAVAWVRMHWVRKTDFRDEEYKFKLPGGGEVTIRPNHTVVRLAHEAWTEIATRKAALPFDPEHDTIEEVYDSWYALFAELRTVIKRIPAEDIRSDRDAKDLLFVLLASLNRGLRPHLTVHQARLRKWLRKNEQEHAYERMSPQEVQKHYPDYPELLASMQETNTYMESLCSSLSNLAHSKEVNPYGET